MTERVVERVRDDEVPFSSLLVKDDTAIAIDEIALIGGVDDWEGLVELALEVEGKVVDRRLKVRVFSVDHEAHAVLGGLGGEHVETLEHGHHLLDLRFGERR